MTPTERALANLDAALHATKQPGVTPGEVGAIAAAVAQVHATLALAEAVRSLAAGAAPGA